MMKKRLITILMIAVLMGAMPAAISAADQTPDTLTVIIFGDSYSAGNGAGDYLIGWRDDPTDMAYQSENSRGRVLAEMIEAATGIPVFVDDYSHTGAVTMSWNDYHVSLSSSELDAADQRARDGVKVSQTLSGQIDQALQDYGGFLPQAVYLIGIGGNDIGFTDVAVKALIFPYLESDARKVIENAYGLLNPAMDRLEGQLVQLIMNTEPGSVIMLQGYPYLANANDPLTIYGYNGINAPDDVLGLLGSQTSIQPGDILRLLNDMADAGYQDLVGKYAPLAEALGIELRFKSYAADTDGGAPYLDGFPNPDRLINSLTLGDINGSVHPSAALHALMGMGLFDIFATTEYGQALIGEYLFGDRNWFKEIEAVNDQLLNEFLNDMSQSGYDDAWWYLVLTDYAENGLSDIDWFNIDFDISDWGYFDDSFWSDLFSDWSDPFSDYWSDPFADLWSDPFSDFWSDPFSDYWSDPFSDFWSDPFSDLWFDPFSDYWFDPFSDYWSDPFSDYWSDPFSDYWSDPFSDYWSDPFSDYWSDPFSDYWSDPFSDYWSDPYSDYWFDPFSDYGSDPFYDSWSDPFSDYWSDPFSDYWSDPFSDYWSDSLWSDPWSDSFWDDSFWYDSWYDSSWNAWDYGDYGGWDSWSDW